MAAGVAPEGAGQSSAPEGGRRLKALLDAVDEARARRREAGRRTADVLRALPDSVRIVHAVGVPHGSAAVYHLLRQLNEVAAGRAELDAAGARTKGVSDA